MFKGINGLSEYWMLRCSNAENLLPHQCDVATPINQQGNPHDQPNG
jgi:hypothetical protein